VFFRGRPEHFTFTLVPLTGLGEPPAPFTGSATCDTKGAWAGNLNVKLAGRTARLTAPQFRPAPYASVAARSPMSSATSS